VSILDGLAKGRGGTADTSALNSTATHFAGRLVDGVLPAAEVLPAAKVAAAWTDHMGQLVEDVDLPGWEPQVCAETNTLACRRGVDVNQLFRSGRAGNRVTLLASDTTRGLAAAMLAGSRLAAGDLTRLRYTTTAGPVVDLPSGTVTVVRVAGLAPDATDGLLRGAAGLGAVLRAAGDAAGDESIEVHLTGGFKSALLHLLSMTELLHSMKGDTVTAWYLYDDVPGRATTVPIGLRRFSPTYLNWMRSELSAADDGREPAGWGPFTLHGSAWESTTGTPTLTPFGKGYLSLLGTSPEDHSDEGG